MISIEPCVFYILWLRDVVYNLIKNIVFTFGVNKSENCSEDVLITNGQHLTIYK